MKDFFKVLRTYLPPYKNKIVLNIIFNVFGALFEAFSFLAMIPVLRQLFGLEEKVYKYKEFNVDIHNLGAALEILKNNVNAWITELSNTKGAVFSLIVIGLFLITMVFFKSAFNYLASFYMTIIRNNVVRDIRNRIYRKCLSLPIAFYSNERKGDLIARMSGDVQEVEMSVMNSLDMFFKNPIKILVALTTMFIMSWKMTLFVLLFMPVAGGIIGRIGKSLKKKSTAGQNKLGEILSSIEETITGLRIIKAFNAQEKVKTRFSQQNEEFKNIMNRIMWRRFMAHPVSELLGTIIMVIVLWYGGSLILKDKPELDPAKFLVYLIFFYSIINPAKAFSQAMYTIRKGLASMDRINKILHAQSTITEPKNPKPLTSFKGNIKYNDVSFKYNTEWVLKNINIQVEKGKTIALVGQSGSGKSTLVDLLPRFYDVLEGTITVDDIDIRQVPINDLRSLMGIVNQEAILFNDTIFNNIAFGIENATEADVINAAKVANAHEFIMATDHGYQTNIGDRGGKLSGGQRQRLSIARAVLKNPPILILDEATSALDTESEKLVQDALTRLMKNRTSIVIAHRLSTIVHADKIFVMDNGVVAESGTHNELIEKQGKYKYFFDLQNFG